MPRFSGAALRAPVVCMVTDGVLMGEAAFTALVAATARAGVDVIQVRERDVEAGMLMRRTRAAIDAVSGTAARVVVNDRLDVALAAGAAGVHLRGDSFAAARARSLASDGFLVGRSVHSDEEAAQVEAAGGCDYLIFGTVFPSTHKPAGHRPAGLEALRRVCARVRIPVLAVGGITAENAALARAAGAAGVAGISLFQGHGQPDLAGIVNRLRSPV
jgi:thiamine-phosphate pyrophosphorylase